MGSFALPVSLCSLQGILSLPVRIADDDAHGISDLVNVLSEVKGFVNLIVDDEDRDDDKDFYKFE